eukprot:TRINITY_DN1216_c0_g1_i2.p1 TRINITY_DN1216_c0_g1~~TRINITY_DN1216_c0_g1_i2.p1  ORF type:complete len:401 (+),score=92.11 TRINITY_DN1216_c0_g1_i2:81-1283(+)
MALPQETTDAVFKKLLSLPENKTCVECGKTNPKWASATFGVFICLECSALHRSMGVHISFVRSCELDEWHHEQVSRMALGGNSRATSFFRARGAGSLRGKAKYTSKAADSYKKALDKAAADTPIDLKQYGGVGNVPSATTASAFDDFEWEDTIPVTPPLPVTSPSSLPHPSPSSVSVSPPRTSTASASHTLTYHGGDAPAKTAKKGVKKVSSDFFDDFDAESSSEEEPVNTRPTPSASAVVEPVRQSFSRLQFEESGRSPASASGNTRGRAAPTPKPAAPKADAAHSHTLWDDDDDFPSSGSGAKKSVYGGHSGSSSRGGGRSTYGNASSYGGSSGYGNDYSSPNNYSNNYNAPSANSYGGSSNASTGGGRRGDFFDDDDDWGSSRCDSYLIARSNFFTQ